MKFLKVIAYNTYLEVIRDRILMWILFFTILLFGFSIAMGSLSFDEQTKVTADFGFAVIQLSMVGLAMFSGYHMLNREVEKRTIYTVLARPISRGQWVVGKFLGYTLLQITIVSSTSLALLGLLKFLGANLTQVHVYALVATLFESLVILAVTVFWSMISQASMTIFFAIATFAIGHWMSDLTYFAQKAESAQFMFFAKVVQHVFPNLELLNFKNSLYEATPPSFMQLIQACAYGTGWVIVLLTLAILIFRRKDLA